MNTVEDPKKPLPIDICKICVLGLAAYFGIPELQLLL